MAESTPPFKSSVPDLKVPEFTSRIPPHLLSKVDEEMRWLLENSDRNTQMTEFTLHGVVAHNNYLRELNGRVAANVKAIGELKADVEAIKEENEQISPFRRALIAFSRLWEWRLFRWVFVAGLLFIAFYVYPSFVDFVSRQPDIVTLLRNWGG